MNRSSLLLPPSVRLPPLAKVLAEIERRRRLTEAQEIAEAEARDAPRLAELREIYEGSLYEFLKAAWAYIDPAPWVDGWCIEALAEHLQAVVDGDIKRLLINIPARTGKSSILAVAFPAWCWAQPERSVTSGPGVRFLYASYAERLSRRDSFRCRLLMGSPWYQALWGDRFSLVQEGAVRLVNDGGGERLITSIPEGGATGEGADIFAIDDANAANRALSEATIEATNDWWDQTASTRLNNLTMGAFINQQQRLSEDDLSGHILEKNIGQWTHLCLPMRFEADRSFTTVIGWSDPRTEQGELLWPERFPEAAVAELEKTMGPWATAGQLQQRPEPKGGGIIKRDWWLSWTEGEERDPETNEIVKAAVFPPMDFIMASLDTAYTEKTENDYSAMTVWGVWTIDTVQHPGRYIDRDGRPVYTGERSINEPAPKVMLMNSWQERLPLHELVMKTGKTCQRYKVDLLVIENKAAGISVAQELQRLFADELWSTELNDPKSADKMARLYSVQHIFAEGMVYAPDRRWADEVINQVGTFPHGRHDDLVDTVSQALRRLRDMGLLVRAPERLAEIEAAKRYSKPAAPLYPA